MWQVLQIYGVCGYILRGETFTRKYGICENTQKEVEIFSEKLVCDGSMMFPWLFKIFINKVREVKAMTMIDQQASIGHGTKRRWEVMQLMFVNDSPSCRTRKKSDKIYSQNMEGCVEQQSCK